MDILIKFLRLSLHYYLHGGEKHGLKSRYEYEPMVFSINVINIDGNISNIGGFSKIGRDFRGSADIMG